MIKERIYQNARAVTPADDTTLEAGVLYVGGAGNVAVTTRNDNDVTFVGVQAGTVLPVLVKVVKATGTTATSILLLN